MIPCGCSTAVCNPTFDPSNNRFADEQGYDYDDAGNVTQDATGKKFVYDAENKQKSFGTGGDDDNGGTYFYDGDGRRVKKIVGTEVAIFVYNAAGKLVAEYATSAPTSSQLNHLTADTLGSPRINTDASGTIVARHDYMPFGEEISVYGNRTSGIEYGIDTVRQKYTQKERVIETGLDYFSARYYASLHGRFMSVDPSRKSINSTNPQTWNPYSYTFNNPLGMVDDNGKWPTKTHDKIVQTAFNTIARSKLNQIQRGSASVDGDFSKPIKLVTESTIVESQAYKHAMTPGSKVKEMGLGAAQQWARGEMNKFIEGKLREATNAFQAGENQNGVNNAALTAFGEAMHPVMDDSSPAHRGMQVYDISLYLNAAKNGGVIAGLATYIADTEEHAATEAREPTQDEMNTMVDQLRIAFLQTFGQEEYERAVSPEERRATANRERERQAERERGH